MTSKGFKPEPHISAGEAARLERICDAVLSDDTDAPERFVAWSNRITQRLGGEKAWERWFVHCANDDLGCAIAAGSSEENGEIKGDHINRKCMQRLALVWRGDRFSMTEVIGLLDKHSRGKAA